LLFLTNWGFTVCIGYFGCATCCSFLKLFTRRRRLGFAFYLAVCTLFEVGLLLEGSITVLYWSLIYPGENLCGMTCLSAHAVSTSCITLDYMFNRHYLEARHLRRVLVVCAVWLTTQLAWVYTGHTGVYKVLTLRDSMSIIVVLGANFTLTVVFYVLQRLGRWRDYINGDYESQPFSHLDDLDDYEL